MADSGGTPETTRERRQAYCDAINQALFWNEGGDLIGPSSELPVGSVQQLIWERATFAFMALADAEAAEKDAEIRRLRAEAALRDAPWQEQGLWQRMKDADPVLRDQLLAAWNERDKALRGAATARARQLPNDVCGATDQDGAVVCMLPPHSVELLPEGDANHHRWHQDWRGGSLWAEWSSVTDDDAGRLWPDGHIGPRAARVVD